MDLLPPLQSAQMPTVVLRRELASQHLPRPTSWEAERGGLQGLASGAYAVVILWHVARSCTCLHHLPSPEGGGVGVLSLALATATVTCRIVLRPSVTESYVDFASRTFAGCRLLRVGARTHAAHVCGKSDQKKFVLEKKKEDADVLPGWRARGAREIIKRARVPFQP
ncbi:hypothetical protein BaRGS_00020494 [Batillaria attramentaria]|uniref:Uncharacterized protein n=1 Tax=Batillaria attramentaria TaxID=370345 RepID=A0ABD0KN82_9CAEN